MSYLNEINAVWESVKNNVAESKNMTGVVTDLWFGDMSVVAMDEKKITMSTPSEFKYDIIIKKYLEDIRRAFSEALGFEINVELVCSEKKENGDTPKPAENAGAERTPSEPQETAQGAPRYVFEYTFDNFIVGNSNKFAHAACTAVADHPAQNYNPLFIYGPSGIGKTHLLYAVTNKIKKDRPDVKIVYVKGVDFTNQFISALAAARIDEFRNKYRSCDVLLIDDIQFIAGKDSTQEEFFNTFNALYEDHKQIILSSDRPPREMKTLEERLKTRFEWGLLADIQPPDLELRIAIIQKKAEQVGITLGDEVLSFLAENLRSNIRQIEGAIKKLGAVYFLEGKEITLENAKECVSDLLDGQIPTESLVKRCFAAIEAKYGISKAELTGQKRTKEIVNARHIAIYLIRSTVELSLPNIGKIFNRDHTTIMSSIENVEKRLRNDSAFRRETEALKKEILG